MLNFSAFYKPWLPGPGPAREAPPKPQRTQCIQGARARPASLALCTIIISADLVAHHEIDLRLGGESYGGGGFLHDRWPQRPQLDVTVRDDVTGEILARVAVDMAAALLGLEGQSYPLYTLYTSRSHGML